MNFEIINEKKDQLLIKSNRFILINISEEKSFYFSYSCLNEKSKGFSYEYALSKVLEQKNFYKIKVTTFFMIEDELEILEGILFALKHLYNIEVREEIKNLI